MLKRRENSPTKRSRTDQHQAQDECISAERATFSPEIFSRRRSPLACDVPTENPSGERTHMSTRYAPSITLLKKLDKVMHPLSAFHVPDVPERARHPVSAEQFCSVCLEKTAIGAENSAGGTRSDTEAEMRPCLESPKPLREGRSQRCDTQPGGSKIRYASATKSSAYPQDVRDDGSTPKDIHTWNELESLFGGDNTTTARHVLSHSNLAHPSQFHSVVAFHLLCILRSSGCDGLCDQPFFRE